MNTHNLDKDGTSKQSRLISKVLSPALKLFLRSQVEQVSQLEVKISGSNRQILTGNIPYVSIWAKHAIYQGLHLAQVQLVGEGIRTNLGQVLKGQPLQLVEPVLVCGELLLHEADLNASLQSSLLANALTELLQMLLAANDSVKGQVSWHKITVEPNQLTLMGDLTDGKRMSLLLHCGLQLLNCHKLQLTQIQLQSPNMSLQKLDNFQIDLGSHVNLQELTLHPGRLACRGEITVMP